MRTGKSSVLFWWGVLFLCAAAIRAGPKQAVAQAFPPPKLTPITVTISPPKATLLAGETQVFAATIVGDGDKTVLWSVAEEDGGTITNQGLYTAPKVQGVYHVTAARTSDPQKRAVATVTVLTYCDPPPTFVRQ